MKLESHTLRHAAGEFVLIVAGVLVALGAQAWWQNRDNHEREHQYLRALLADADENAVALQQSIVKDSTYASKARRLHGALESAAPIPPDSMNRWFGVSFSDFYPVTGTLETLVATGDIRLLRSERLRHVVGQLASEYRGAMDQLGRTATAAWSTPLGEVIARHKRRGAAMDINGLANDPQLDAVALTSLGIDKTRLDVLKRLQDRNSELQALVRQELH